jgi:formate hydrogenlyase subunit 3/multisubunit Na+/H+ antiporter MnhD subunit
MTTWFLLLPWLLPLLLLPLPVNRRTRWLPLLAAVPAVATALFAADGSTAELGWLLLGTHLALDSTARLFLLFSSLAWFAAALYSLLRPTLATGRSRFRIAFLLSMSGNFLLILAADMISFYLGFALMGLSAYGMIVAPATPAAIGAGRRYLGWTIAGELALFSGMVLLASGASGLRFADLAAIEPGPAALFLILAGFGVKMALPGLHFWLPAAYREAPAAAAAVLSGPMLAAGLLGWLRFLHPETATDLGMLVVTLGIAGTLLGIAGGVLQPDARGVLAWSSIAKAGTMTAILGAAFARPEASTAILAALALFAMHHLLIKSALFLGMGELDARGRRRWIVAGLALLALSLAGAPWSGGAAAKALLGEALGMTDLAYSTLLTAGAVGTAMLMARFLWLVLDRQSRAKQFDAVSLGWLVLAIAAAWLPFGLFQGGFSSSGVLALFAGVALFAATRGLVVGKSATIAMPVPALDMQGGSDRLSALRNGAARLTAMLQARLERLAMHLAKRLTTGTAQALFWLALFAILLATLVAPA